MSLKVSGSACGPTSTLVVSSVARRPLDIVSYSMEALEGNWDVSGDEDWPIPHVGPAKGYRPLWKAA